MPRYVNTTGAFPRISQKNIYFADNLCYNKHVYVDFRFIPIVLHIIQHKLFKKGKL